jgi:lysophospholipase L1-like esterase
VNNAVAFIREFANVNKLNIIDVHSCPLFCPENEHIMQPNDGLHFSELGYKTMAEFIAEGVLNNFNRTKV